MFRHNPVAALALGLVCVLCPLVSAMAGPVNINTADAATLARELKGVGLKRAQAIVDYRSQHGPFRSPDELSLVKGIGAKAIEANRADIRVDARASTTTPATPAASRPAKEGSTALPGGNNSPKTK